MIAAAPLTIPKMPVIKRDLRQLHPACCTSSLFTPWSTDAALTAAAHNFRLMERQEEMAKQERGALICTELAVDRQYSSWRLTVVSTSAEKLVMDDRKRMFILAQRELGMRESSLDIPQHHPGICMALETETDAG